MSEFTASNGVQVRPGHLAGLHITCNGDGKAHDLSDGEAEALREYFQQERDEELGRWRWPENPDYVMTPDVSPGMGGRMVRVLNERKGTVTSHYEHGTKDRGIATKAVTAFFEAHPERKPWEDAKPGDLWAINIGDDAEHANWQGVVGSNGGRFLYRDGGSVAIDQDFIIDGRRIWPEVS